MSDCAHFHPIFCILPPYILTEISNRGTTEQQDWARKSQSITTALRNQRANFLPEMVSIEKALAGKSRVVYDANHGDVLPGNKLRGEGDPPSSDVAVNEAYDGAGATYDLYHDVYGRASVDNKDLRLDSSVHYQTNYDNAFWNGQQMVYGDGDVGLPPDQQLFNRFTICIDVIGHELTHGVTQYTANLTYSDQPGALNESISDVFGSLVKQRALGQTAAQADWLIGKGLLAARVKGVALRSLKAPGTAYDDPVLGKDPQPANMKDYQNMGGDSGGVHINSGIPNHAFYVVATEIGGNAWEKAGRIWYVTLRDKLRASSDFQEAANLTLQTAGELFGANSLEQQAVSKGWAEAGITVQVLPPPTPPPPTPVPPPPPPPSTNSGCLSTPKTTLQSIVRRLFGR
jgi:Zn-dependent metalloprotease